MNKNYKHCVIDFKNKIVKTYDEGIDFRYDPVECTYLIDVTISNLVEGIGISGSEIHMRYTDKQIELSDIDGVVKESCIKKSGTTKLEKWFGCKEYEYVEGKYYVKYNDEVTKLIIPKDTFIFKHTTANNK
jgi:hypothetical protein